MDSKQIFMIVAIVVAFSSVNVAIPVMAQMADNASMGNLTAGNLTGGNMTGSISGYEEDAECSKSPACIS
jgi:hypothetical protein